MPEYDDELARIVAELNRAAPGGATLEKPSPRHSQDTSSLDPLLLSAVRQNASDLLIVAGYGVSLRVNGSLAPPAGPPLSGEDARALVLPLLDARQYEELQRNKSVDFCFVREPIGRFRANLHYQRGTLAASIRLLPAKIPTLESLHLPAALARLAERRHGLVLVTGPTGCGKTSTLAALIDLINTRRRDHIVTIEDPIEYQHPSRSSVVEQIEVGHDTPEFVQLAARHSAAVARRDPGGGNARRRNHGDGTDRGGDGPPGLFHAAHQRRSAGGESHSGLVSPQRSSRRSGSSSRWRCARW